MRYYITKAILLTAAVGALVLAVYFFIAAFNSDTDAQNTLYATLGTLLLIGSIVFLQFSNVDLYNSMNDTVKSVSNRKEVGLEQIFDAFKNLQTGLGSPWMGRVKSVKNDVIILGPNQNGEYVFINTLGPTRVTVNFNDRPSFLVPDAGDEWRLTQHEEPETLDDVIRYVFGMACILPELTKRVQEYLDTGIADLTPLGIGQTEEIYLFNEEFKWTGQDFYLFDTDGNEKLKVSSTVPCKTFRITDLEQGEEVLWLTKRIFHIMPHYDFYEQGRKLGRLRKKIVLHHDYFVGDTVFGKLELRSMNAMIGANYQVRLDGRQIGTVARKLNIELENAVFDNYILSVNDPKFLPLMTAMGIMAAREARRDLVAAAETLSD